MLHLYLMLHHLAQRVSNIVGAGKMAGEFVSRPGSMRICLLTSHWPETNPLAPSKLQGRLGNVACCEATARSPYCIILCQQVGEGLGKACEGRQEVWGPVGSWQQTLTLDVSSLFQASLHPVSISLPSLMPRPRSGCPQTTFSRSPETQT